MDRSFVEEMGYSKSTATKILNELEAVTNAEASLSVLEYKFAEKEKDVLLD